MWDNPSNETDHKDMNDHHQLRVPEMEKPLETGCLVTEMVTKAFRQAIADWLRNHRRILFHVPEAGLTCRLMARHRTGRGGMAELDYISWQREETMQDRAPEFPMYMNPDYFEAMYHLTCPEGKLLALNDCMSRLEFPGTPVVWRLMQLVIMDEDISYETKEALTHMRRLMETWWV
jgi:hypothetical protein